MSIVIKACSCEHEYQDKKYGKKMRVHNLGQNNSVRCTVCGNSGKGAADSKGGKK